MSKPNIFNGMKRRGIGRAPVRAHLKKQDKSFAIEDAKVKKAKLEEARRERIIKEYLL